MRMRRAHQNAVQSAWHLDVRDEAAVAEQQPPILNATQRRADAMRGAGR